MVPSKLSSIKVWIYFTVLSAGLLSLSSCQRLKQPSVLILTIDRLAFNSFSCSDDKQNTASGLNILCKEGIRFTHAYTTSTQPAAALASVLTGTYPLHHKLHRSFDRLDSSVKMIQEFASPLGYKTYFLGGSPTVLKKTGMAQGFDIFDDSSFIEKKTYFLDFKFQSEKFMSLIAEDKTSFFGVIHNSELESLNEGESEISSFERLDEKLFHFFNLLKKQNVWDKNYIVVVGLMGESDYSRLSETPFSNLNSENTQVTLFVKPPRVKGDEGVAWKVDSVVSLADLGHSLWTTITLKNNPNEAPLNDAFPVVDISATWLDQNKSLSLPARKILIEATDTWSKNLKVRFSIVQKNLLFVENKKNMLFNTLTDGLESIDISGQQKLLLEDMDLALKNLRTKYSIGIWKEHQSRWNSWVLSNREYWSKPNSRVSFFNNELERLNRKNKSQPLSTLLLRHLTTLKKTKDLKINLVALPLKSGTLPEKSKDAFYEYAKLHSINLALENIWGIWQPNQNWIYSDLIFENQ